MTEPTSTSGTPRTRQFATIAWRVVASALAVALLLKWGVVDGYEVRGNSMHPLLIDRAGEPDRVVVLKPWYRFFEPERFDLVVFERPESEGNGTNDEPPGDRFVKRVIGMPGETIRIEGGDVYIDGSAAPLRKPLPVLLEMLEPVALNDAEWQATGATRDGSAWKLVARADAPAELRYVGVIRDAWIDEHGEVRAGGDSVTDVAMTVRVGSTSADAGIELELRDAGDTFVCEISSEGRVRLHRRDPADVVVAEAAVPELAAHSSGAAELLFANVDNEVRLLVAGRSVIEFRYDKNTPVEGVAISAEPAVRVTRGTATIERIALDRDVSYTDAGTFGALGRPVKIPAGAYFLLGDNSANSRDSRYFGPIARDRFRGRPWFILSPWHRFRWL